jgi:pimeloyl-ACP methyl ester carboxylesterase
MSKSTPNYQTTSTIANLSIPQVETKSSNMSLVPAVKHADIGNNVTMFYRELGPPDAPVVLLLHGFPSSSHQYRNLIPVLATMYRVIAPDLPGFGFTTSPDGYQYTFANFAIAVGGLLDVLSISKFSMYIFDYGAPTGLRLALERPSAVTAIVSQNGNAYVEGLGAFWDPIKKYWTTHAPSDREALRSSLLSYNTTKLQYTLGAHDPNALAPETWNLDYTLISRPGNGDIQLDIFYDYRTNVDIYPEFQAYFRKSQVPLLAVWGEHDIIFVPPGAEAFKRDLPHAEVHLIDAGHFSLESNLKQISDLMLGFLKRVHGKEWK